MAPTNKTTETQQTKAQQDEATALRQSLAATASGGATTDEQRKAALDAAAGPAEVLEANRPDMPELTEEQKRQANIRAAAHQRELEKRLANEARIGGMAPGATVK